MLFLAIILLLALSGNFYAEHLAYLLGLTIIIYIIAFTLPQIPIPTDISYGIYLWHVPVFLTIRHLWGGVEDPMFLYVWGTAFILLLSWLSAHLVEIPCIRWAGRRAKRWRKA